MSFTKNSRFIGIIYIICAGFFFSIMSFMVRLSGDLPVMEKAFFRNSVAAIFSIVILARSEEKFKIKKGSIPGLLIRSAFGTAGLILNFMAIDKIGLADANILNKLSPFFAIIVSIFVLKEKANLIEWICVILAFTGAAFVIRPSGDITSLYGFFGMLGGLGAGVAYAFVRKLGKQGERGPVIVMCFSIFSCLVTLPFLILQFKPMSIIQLLCLLGAGLAATGGQMFITMAYTKAPASEISVFDYTQILFAAMIGFFFLGEIPDLMSVIGYAIIIGVAIFKWAYQMRKK